MNIAHLDEVEREATSHARVFRRILLSEHQLPHGVRLSQAILEPGDRVQPHRHDDLCEVFYILAGSGIFTIDGVSYPVRVGSAISIDPGEEHQILNSSGDKLAMLYFALAAD